MTRANGSGFVVRNPTIPTPFKRRTQNLSSASLLRSARIHSMNETSSVFDHSGAGLPIMAHPRSFGGHSQQPSTSSNTSWRNDAGSTFNARAKHTEFLAERQHMMLPTGRLNSPPGLSQAGIPWSSGSGRFLDTEVMDAPPAYSGKARESMRKDRPGYPSGRRGEVGV